MGTGSDIGGFAAQVNRVPQGKTYLVLSVINENIFSERRGGDHYKVLMHLNDALAETYGEHYLDIRSILVNSYDPSQPADVSDFESDMPPTSLGSVSAVGTLTSSIGIYDESFSVNMTKGQPVARANLLIDDENIKIITVEGSTITHSIRGYGGKLASHSAGAAVTQRDDTHLNKDGDIIVAKAVAAKLAALAASSTTSHIPQSR